MRIGWILLVVLLVAELASVFFLSRRGQVTEAPSGSGAAPEVARERTTPGYTFDEPEGWNVQRDGDTTILTREDSASIISIGLFRGDDPEAVSDRVVSLLEEQYRRLTVLDETSDGTTVTVEGRALNSDRVRLRVTAITTSAGEGCQHQVIAFSDVGVPRSRIQGVVDDVLASLEPTGDGCGGSLGA